MAQSSDDTDIKAKRMGELIERIGRDLDSEYSRRLADTHGFFAAIDGDSPELSEYFVERSREFAASEDVGKAADRRQTLFESLQSDIRELEQLGPAEFTDSMAEAVDFMHFGEKARYADEERAAGKDLRRVFAGLSAHMRRIEKEIIAGQNVWDDMARIQVEPFKQGEGNHEMLNHIFKSACNTTQEVLGRKAGPIALLNEYQEVARKCREGIRRQFEYKWPASGGRGDDRYINILIGLFSDLGFKAVAISSLFPELGLNPKAVDGRILAIIKREVPD